MKRNFSLKKRYQIAFVLVIVMIVTGGFPAGAAFVRDGLSLVNTGDNGEVIYGGDLVEVKKEAFAAASKSETEEVPEEEENFLPASKSELVATPPELRSVEISAMGDIWDSWNGDFTFLNGTTGNGSESKPYQIKNKAQLMGFSQLVAMGMRVQPGEGNSEIIGSYDGKYFELGANIDLGGMAWNPIGFYRDSTELSGEVVNKFFGNFNGNGKTVSNFKLNNSGWSNVGFFGAIEDATVENLNLNPGKTVYGKNNVAILAGSSVNSRIQDCKVNGSISAGGNAGGIVADASGTGKDISIIENCTANVTIDASGGASIYVGGIAGKAANTSIVDCRVETGENNTARIQGRNATVGGITALQNNTDIYNCYVSGTIGGTGSLVVGGITGRYVSGHMKVARFAGVIGQSGTGAAGRFGTFIGDREAGDYFRYGTDVAYLFADVESKLAFNICGSQIPDDNVYTYADHIGYSHGSDNFYSLVQGGLVKNISDSYFYEELEKGILSIMEEDNGGAGGEAVGYELDHFAPNDAGKPTRGYLLTIPQIDTVSSGTNYYDVAVLEARGNSTYYKTIDKEARGAIAAGKSVTVATSAKNTEVTKYQMEGVPTYATGGWEKNTTYVRGGEYTFTMPAENTEVKAVYKKVAVRVTVVPSSYNLSVVEERTGNRKNPNKTTRVTNNEGKLIATYINGVLEQGTQIQPVNIQAIVDTNNDVADNSVKWSIDDSDLIILSKNDDEDGESYSKKSASVKVNLSADFFTGTIKKLEKDQADKNYQYPIPDTIFGAGYQSGGVAVLTAATRPAASFEGKPCTGNSKINVTFQIKDKTFVANEGAEIDKEQLSFTVTRRLTGNRKTPVETFQVTPPQSLTAVFNPDFFDKKDIKWTVNDQALLSVNGENRSASVAVKKEAKWIQDIIATDQGIHENDPFAVLGGSGAKEASVSVIADDMLGNRQTAECSVSIRFVTDDQTKIYVEGIEVKPVSLSYDLTCTKTGRRNKPTIVWTGAEGKKLEAFVYPKLAFDRKYSFKVSDDALMINRDGEVSVNTTANWIQKINQAYPYSGGHVAQITAVTEDGGFKAVCGVSITYKLIDNTISTDNSSGGGSGGGGSSGGGSSGGAMQRASGPAAGIPSQTGGVTGTWLSTVDGFWTFASNGKTYRDEWAFIYNPYAAKDQGNTDWFRFDKAGYMITGWFTDTDGTMYYLSPWSNGARGHMVTGWNWIMDADGMERCYYFNQVSDGTRGVLLKNKTTPDGQRVNEKGELVVNGVVQVRVPTANRRKQF